MALIVITVHDSPEGAQVGVLMNPELPRVISREPMTAAQTAAMTMLRALEKEISQDRGLVQLIN